MPETFTPAHGLSMFGQGENPGAVKLNANWANIDARLLKALTAFPSTYPAGGFILRTDQGKLYENTGTLEAPTWTQRLANGVAGPEGPEGPPGTDGADGADGDPGPPGPTEPLTDDEDLAYDRLDLQFFAAHSLLPAVKQKLAYATFPARDFSNLNGWTPTVARASYKLVATGGGNANFGWDVGAGKGESLLVFGGMIPRGYGVGLAMSPNAPVAAEWPNSTYVFEFETATAGFGLTMAHITGGSWTQITSDGEILWPNDKTNVFVQLALYRKDSGGLLYGFWRTEGGAWSDGVILTGQNAYTSMRYFGVRLATPGGVPFYMKIPVALYTS